MNGSKVLAGFALALSVSMAPSAVHPKEQPSKTSAYKKAKETISPDLYVIYRITDRLITANSIKRPIRVAVRRGLSTAQLACPGALGVEAQSAKCQAYELLPDVDQATNFDLWAAQVIATMTGSPNAAATSDSGSLYVNVAMLKEVAGKPDQLACVIGHELAHITQNHNEQKRKKQTEYNAVAASKITAAAKNAHNAQRSSQTWMMILAGVSSGLSGNNTAIYQTSNQIALANMAAQIAAPEIAKEALKYSPEIGDAMNSMQGLAPGYIKRTSLDINNYLRDAALSLAGSSRALEYEADLLGLEYVTTAGFNPTECIRLWKETMPHDNDKLITRLLPQGVADPALQTQGESIAVSEQATPQEDVCRGNSRLECRQTNKTGGRSKQPSSAQVPAEVMQTLLSSHPDHASRAVALSNHLDAAAKARLIAKGKAALSTPSMRDWSYDKTSDSVVISENLVAPKQAGSGTGGTSGIDVDKALGF